MTSSYRIRHEGVHAVAARIEHLVVYDSRIGDQMGYSGFLKSWVSFIIRMCEIPHFEALSSILANVFREHRQNIRVKVVHENLQGVILKLIRS